MVDQKIMLYSETIIAKNLKIKLILRLNFLGFDNIFDQNQKSGLNLGPLLKFYSINPYSANQPIGSTIAQNAGFGWKFRLKWVAPLAPRQLLPSSRPQILTRSI